LNSVNRVANLESQLQDQMLMRCNTKAEDISCMNDNYAMSRLAGSTMELKMEEAKNSKAQPVVLLIPGFDRSIYAEFKHLTDRKYNLRPLCLAKPSQLADSKYMTNVAEKVNNEFGGINSSVPAIQKFLDTKTLVLGANLAHPPGGALEDIPSIVCMVGSIDNLGGCIPR
jgi:hypothetical protein